MKKLPCPTYDRAPSKRLLELLHEGGFLAPFIALHGKKKGEFRLALDVHLRREDEVHVYYGLTKLVTSKLKTNDTLEIDAAESHKRHDRNNFFRVWHVDETGFQDYLDDYIDVVTKKIDTRWFVKEGQVQAIWSRVAMPDGPWTSFDREAVLDFSNCDDPGKEAATFRNFSQVEDAYSCISQISNTWSKSIPAPGTELDQLAVDREGNLVLVEIKYAGKDYKADTVYYSPLQLLQYVHEWSNALEHLPVREGLQKLICARVGVGLIETPDKPLTRGVRAAVCFGEDKRSTEVRRRYQIVLDIVNQHLPPAVAPIETWEYGETGPHCLL